MNKVEAWLKNYLEAIVQHPQNVEIQQEEGELVTRFKVHVNQEDVGRVKGRHGRVVQALQNLLGVNSSQTKRRWIIDIENP